MITVCNAKGMKIAGIRYEICDVYGENRMSYGMVRKLVRAFKDVRTIVHNEKRSGQPQNIDEKVRENRFFTTSRLCSECPQMSRSMIHRNCGRTFKAPRVMLTVDSQNSDGEFYTYIIFGLTNLFGFSSQLLGLIYPLIFTVDTVSCQSGIKVQCQRTLEPYQSQLKHFCCVVRVVLTRVKG